MFGGCSWFAHLLVTQLSHTRFHDSGRESTHITLPCHPPTQSSASPDAMQYYNMSRRRIVVLKSRPVKKPF